MRALVPFLAPLLVLACPPARACSVALVLAMDVSGSVDPEEYALQKAGLASALADPAVAGALVEARALVSVVQWSGRSRQDVSIPWTAIAGPGDVAALRARVAGMRRAYRNYATAIGEVLGRALDLLEEAPRPCDRRVIDVSGDGESNEGMAPARLHARLAREEVTVNGLAILGSEAGIGAYYRARVLFGPGAFLEIADGYADFPRAIRRKLIAELSLRVSEPMRPPPVLRTGTGRGDEAWRSASETRSNGPGARAPGRERSSRSTRRR